VASGVILVSDDDLVVVLDVPVIEVSGLGDWVPTAAMRVVEVVEQGFITAPFVVVAVGDACVGIPAFAVSQRAARRQIAGYVFIEPVLPTVGASDWPDAPVTVVTCNESTAHSARLRGWTVSSDAAADVIAAVVEES
jgi:hypothetical protein